jgi:hypothetical protein
MRKYVLLIVVGTLGSLGVVLAARAETPPAAAAAPAVVLPALPACLSIDQPIAFTATGGLMDAVNLRFGTPVENESGRPIAYGSTTVSASSSAVDGADIIGKSRDGEIAIKITKKSASQMYSSGFESVDLIGRLELTKDATAIMRRDLGLAPNAPVCVTGIALDGGVYQGTLYAASVYLYLDGSPAQGVIAQF